MSIDRGPGAGDDESGPGAVGQGQVVFRRPAVLLTGVVAGLATVLAVGGFLAGAGLLEDAGVENVWLVFAVGVLANDAVVVLTAPVVRPGLLAAVSSPPADQGLRAGMEAVAAATRRHVAETFVAALTARLAGYGFAFLLAPVLVALVLIGATGASLLAYAADVVSTPDPKLYLYGVLGLAFSLRAAGFVPVAFAAALAGTETPRRAWRRSAGLVRQDPLGAGRVALVSVVLGGLPIAVGLTVVVIAGIEDALGLPVFLAVVLGVATVTRPEEALVVGRYLGREGTPDSQDGSAESLLVSVDPQRLVPSLTTVLAVLLVAGLAVGSAGLRAGDYRPLHEPGRAELGAGIGGPGGDAGAFYAAARDRTTATSRNVTTIVVGTNVTTGERTPTLRSHVVVDVPAREGTVTAWIAESDGQWSVAGAAYVSDGLYLRSAVGSRPRYVFGQTRVGGWQVYAAPQYATFADSFPVGRLPGSGTQWENVTVAGGTAVLTIDDPETVQTLVGRHDPDVVRYRPESRIRVAIDVDSQRLERVEITERYDVYRSDDRQVTDDRVHSEETLSYRYGSVTVDRPNEVGFRPLALLWDLIYY